MRLSLGISPCPNDTFIFDWLIHHGPQKDLLSPTLYDVQQLNEMVQRQQLDVAKISYATLPAVLHNYVALRAGGAMGEGVGPLLIGRTPPPHSWPHMVQELAEQEIALPGKNTTANLLFRYAFPGATKTSYHIFNTIEQFVKSGRGLGVIIHENRFTYQRHGLHKWLDLGEHWQQQESLPIPLGVIVMKKSLATRYAGILNAGIKKSLQYSWNNYPALSGFVTNHASEMDEDTMREHIKLYVNAYSEDVGERGLTAVRHLLGIPPGTSLFYQE